MKHDFQSSKVSEYNDESSQRFDSYMSTENINRPISFKNEKDDCTNNEETESDIQHGKWMKAAIEQPFIGKMGLKVEIQIKKIQWNVSSCLLHRE